MYLFTSGKNHNEDYEPPKQSGNRFGWTSTMPATEPGNESKPEENKANEPFTFTPLKNNNDVNSNNN
jgi:hypothetical protein